MGRHVIVGNGIAGVTAAQAILRDDQSAVQTKEREVYPLLADHSLGCRISINTGYWAIYITEKTI